MPEDETGTRPPNPFSLLYASLASSASGGFSSLFKNTATRYLKLVDRARITLTAGVIPNSGGDQETVALIDAESRGGKYALYSSNFVPLTAASPTTANTGNAASAELVSAALMATTKGLVLCNNGANDVTLGFGVAAEASKGIVLKANGGTWIMDAATCYTAGAINGYAAATTAVQIQRFT